MRNATINIIETIIGASLIGLGLIYLTSQHTALEKLMDTVRTEITKDEDIYQQFRDINFNLISDDDLSSTIMGYREFPIMVDEHLIPTDKNDYDEYFSYIKDGYYEKRYVYDAVHKLVQIVYTYTGSVDI